MKILYALQATGNGHTIRAKQLLPYLSQIGHLDVFVSGSYSNIALNFPVTYRSRGVSFRYTAKGGISYLKTLSNLRPLVFKEITEFPVDNYDLVVNDFELISAWACKLKQVPCIAVSHQSAYLSDKTPTPAQRDRLGELVLRYYAPPRHYIGLHFQKYDQTIETPVIRHEIRQTEPENQGHYTVYLPAYSDQYLTPLLSSIDVQWEVFSREAARPYSSGNIHFSPIAADTFSQSLITSEGVLTSGGFETPAEALYLGKKLFVIPIKGQYEQQCNAEALSRMGIPTLPVLHAENLHHMNNWVTEQAAIHVDYQDNIPTIIDKLLTLYQRREFPEEGQSSC